jgi:hypothetical protein
MMKKFRLLLLDANVVITLHELSLWDKVVEKCEVILTETVVKEAKFFESQGQRQGIDLSGDISATKIGVISIGKSEQDAFLSQFDPNYLERLDPGEVEALAYLLGHPEPFLLCSGDAIVFKVLGRLRRGDQGVFLEEILRAVGLATALEWAYTADFRKRYTKEGQRDMITESGLKKEKGK